jgi:hypothetical protein
MILFVYKFTSKLTTFQRFPGGVATGDQKVIDQIGHLFFRI